MIPLSQPDITDLEKQYVLEVLDSGQLSFGPKLSRFEQLICQQTNRKYALAMNSGTSALHLAVKSLDLGEGDEVITTSYSFIASGNCLLYEGVKPVFVDIDPGTLNMDIDRIENAITSKTKAILVVHIFGQTVPMEGIIELADRYNLKIIEDACEALGATWKGRPAGSFGDVGVIAFYPNKQITTGEGGVLVTDNEEIYGLAKSWRNQGRNLESAWLSHDRVGYNYRMSDLQAAVGCAQMERLDEILGKRDRAAKRYLQLIDDYELDVQTLYLLPNGNISWFVFIVVLPADVHRQYIIDYLSNQGVQSKPYFPCIHTQPCYEGLYRVADDGLDVTLEKSKRTLAIPFYSNLQEKKQRIVIQHLWAAIKEGRKNADGESI